MSYVITVQNLGNVDAPDMQIFEYLEPWFRYIAATPSPDSIDQMDDSFPPSHDGQQYDAFLNWNIPSYTLAAGSNINFGYTVHLDPGSPSVILLQDGPAS